MRNITIFSALLSLLLAGCLHEPVHQGNRLDGNEVNLIQEGDTKFTIEQKLGSPVLNSDLHPHRITYYEMFEDEDTGDMRQRGVEITYDAAWRAKKIRRFGFQ
ncbi:MAG: outer membrane protein assembly factor BamE [Mariprofundus sp.]|nr:outer membrane protein assembly factor BamE [Mariprofundus sp.]